MRGHFKACLLSFYIFFCQFFFFYFYQTERSTDVKYCIDRKKNSIKFKLLKINLFILSVIRQNQILIRKIFYKQSKSHVLDDNGGLEYTKDRELEKDGP